MVDDKSGNRERNLGILFENKEKWSAPQIKDLKSVSETEFVAAGAPDGAIGS